jgi:hypothetical protein
LKKKLQSVLGAPGAVKRAEEVSLDDEPLGSPAPKAQIVSKPASKAVPPKEVDFDDDDESLSYFAKLANEE